jgi:hypothetical protein
METPSSQANGSVTRFRLADVKHDLDVYPRVLGYCPVGAAVDVYQYADTPQLRLSLRVITLTTGAKQPLLVISRQTYLSDCKPPTIHAFGCNRTFSRHTAAAARR